MSRIDGLIAELCPGGVELKALGELLERIANIRWQDVQGEEFKYLDLTSVDRDTHAISDTETINNENAPSRAQQIVQEGDVIFGTTRPMLKRYCQIPKEYDGQICSTGYCVLRPKTDLLLPSFVFHLLGTESFYSYVEANQRGASYPAITDAAVKAYRIPLPPLEVQREIVKILDAFTELEVELEAELEARQKQYQYYRDELLRFEGREDVRWATLGEVADLNWGDTNTTKSSYIESGGYPAFSAAGKDGFLPHYDYDRRAVVLSAIGALAGKTWLAYGKWSCIKNTIRFFSLDESVVTTDYLFWITFKPNFWPRRGSAQPFITKGDADQVVVPIPPLEEQTRISEILDKFDGLLNDISSGLPAEIAARRKQYAHYRDKLLSFKEAT